MGDVSLMASFNNAECDLNSCISFLFLLSKTCSVVALTITDGISGQQNIYAFITN